MFEWWESLTQLERIFAYIAVPSTVLLLVQVILTAIGISGHSDADVGQDGSDFDASGHDGFDGSQDGSGVHDGHFDAASDPGLHLFTLRGIIAFFSIFGWTGIMISRNNGGVALSVFGAIVAGAIALFVIAFIFKWMMKLQSDGSVDYKNALGLSATVYITIPPARSDKGKINTLLQGAYMEIDAVTDEETPIKYGEEVVVIGLSGNNTLVVKRK
ncbi:MAG: hypothetical protein A2Y17_05380 [Clostridiales bacterium GWF2_38_85]|nr:MAG: hypothetical protein A2Y17_05380 [Clostridiales bacterium GWF2_38_85]HBL83338.1 hypothetical protein [Clostridiales bacterium]